MQLSECTIKDIETLIAITHQTYREHYQYLWKDKGAFYIQGQYNQAAFKAELSDKNVLLYLIEEEDEIIDFLKLNKDAALQEYSEKEALELERIYLCQKATEKGIGQEVMKTVEHTAKQLNKKVIWLKTMDSSGADKFYEKCGYEICGATRLKIEGIYPHLQRQLVMKKIL